MTSRPALAALIGAMDVPPKEAMKLLTDYRDEVAHELAEEIRNSKRLRDYTDDHMSDCNMAADLIDPKKEGQ